jgi:glutathione synthase/RimK-type ligase-like ATP-grasp enzyme
VSRVALATTSVVVDPDLDALIGALGRRGIDAVGVAWDDEAFDWAGPELVVLRSTWDYAPRAAQFLDWVRRVPRLHNPADVVSWNLDKHYLGDLAARGVPVVGTTYATHGDDAVLPVGAVVVKPAVGAGSRGAHRFAADEHAAARGHVDELASHGLVAMVQPYLEGIERGETSVVVIDGTVSHAVRKYAPMDVPVGALPQGSTSEPTEPSAAELEVVAAVLHAVPGADPLCYARIDLVGSDAGPVVLEAELIEPFLFLASHADAADTLAAAIARRVGEDPTALARGGR